MAQTAANHGKDLHTVYKRNNTNQPNLEALFTTANTL